MEKQVNKPKLRFPEFEGEWEKKRLVEVAVITTGSTPSTKVEDYYNGNRLFVSPADLQGNRYVEKTKTTLTELGFSKGRKIQKGSVLFVCIGSTIGKVGVPVEDCLTNQQINSLNARNDFSNNFIYSLLELNANEIKLLAGVQAVPQINKTAFSNLSFYFPTLPEQTKIASFLTAVDDKLQALKKKKTLLEQYKKGIMQKIFSQELRFKDDNGNEHPDWEERKLGEIAISHYQGINTASEKTNYYSNGYPILQAKHITSETITYYDAKYVSVEDFEKHKEKYNPKINEILISNIGTLGKIVLIEQDVKFLIAWNIFKVKLKENLSNPKYITYVLKNVASKGYFEEVQSGNATKFVNKTEMLGIPIFLPTIPEQTKIANFLSAIDDKTQAVEVQIEKMEVWKKGLLQQMFC